jgi:hypothetical protein
MDYIVYDSKKPDTNGNPKNVIFPTRELAYTVLDELHRSCEYFGRVSVARFHQLSLICASENERHLGWISDDLYKASVVIDKYGGYEIILPDPVSIEPLPDTVDSVDPFDGYEFVEPEIHPVDMPDIPGFALEWRQPDVTVLTDSLVYIVQEICWNADALFYQEPHPYVSVVGAYTTLKKAAESIIDDISSEYGEDEVEEILAEWPTINADEIAEAMGTTSKNGFVKYTISATAVK